MIGARGLPWLLAVFAALLQAHGAMTSGHLMWLAPVAWGLALMLAGPSASRAGQSVGRGAMLGGSIGLISSAHLWGIAYYAGSVYLIVIAYHTLIWAGFSAAATFLLLRAGTLAPLSIGALWALLENLRSLGSLSFPFFFGGMIADELYLAQLASLIGTTGISGLMFWLGFSLAGTLATLWGERRWSSRSILLAPVLCCSLAIVGGWIRVRTAPPAKENLTVSALQGSIPPWMYALASGPGPYRRLVEEHYGFLYRRALAYEPPPDLVLFPETTFNWHIRPTTQGIRRITTLGATQLPQNTGLLFGASFSITKGQGSKNGVAVASATAGGLPELHGVIVKKQLVPFIELGHEPAERWALAQPAEHRIGVMVCYESMYPQAALFAARNGARLLTIVSDDGGMRWAPLARTHSEQARMRAIESGLPLVRAGQAGLSYATDAYGRMLSHIDAWEVGEITQDLPLHDIATPYRRVGLGWSFAFAGIIVFSLWRRRPKGPKELSDSDKAATPP